MTANPLLEVRAASKSFGVVRALRGANLEIHAGEIVALLGDNGAGKSTLIKAISGVHQLDEGEIRVDGRPVQFKTPVDARAHGVETVFQDLAVFDNLNAIDNFFVGRERKRGPRLGSLSFVDRRAMAASWREHMERLRINVPDPTVPISLLSGGQRQAIAVARAVSFATRVALLDEPTAALGMRESAQVLELVKRLPEHGVAVLIISHNLEHVARVADRAVVLRQGQRVGEAVPTPDNHEYLVSLVVGSSSLHE